MYTPYREDNRISFNVPWEINTAKGFSYSLVICLLLLLIGMRIKVDNSHTFRQVEVNRIPIEIINFGDGDGTGISKGNLTAEGMMHKGNTPATNLSDAETAAKTQFDKNVSTINLEDATSFIPTKDVASNEKHDGNATASGTRNIGAPTGSLTGTGLGDKGFGRGAGLGLGNIEWGGGGNRSVIYKPDKIIFPPGAKPGEIRIQFIVDPSGMVISMRPLQMGGDPILLKVAMEHVKKIRFNQIDRNVNMIGVAPFTFKLN